MGAISGARPVLAQQIVIAPSLDQWQGFIAEASRRFGLPAAWIRAVMQAEAYAPGRVELLGNHTDYNQGLVLAGAIERGLRVGGERRNDGRVCLHSSAMGQLEIDLSDLRPQTEALWANYPLGVVRQLCAAGVEIGGFSATIEGDLPAGCGLSSSAAL